MAATVVGIWTARRTTAVMLVSAQRRETAIATAGANVTVEPTTTANTVADATALRLDLPAAAIIPRMRAITVPARGTTRMTRTAANGDALGIVHARGAAATMTASLGVTVLALVIVIVAVVTSATARARSAIASVHALLHAASHLPTRPRRRRADAPETSMTSPARRPSHLRLRPRAFLGWTGTSRETTTPVSMSARCPRPDPLRLLGGTTCLLS